MKRLPPSIQESQRYLKFRVHAEEKVELGDVVNAVWDSVLGFLGTKGASNANFWVIGNRFDEQRQEGVVRVNDAMEDEFRAALTLVDRIGGGKGFIEVVDVSGTIESLG